MVEYMLSENVPLTPPILTGPSAINMAIERRDSQLIRVSRYKIQVLCLSFSWRKGAF